MLKGKWENSERILFEWTNESNSKELGENEDLDEIAELEKKLNQYNLSKEAKEKCTSEIKKLKNMSPMSAEATVIRNYLDWVMSIPWNNPDQFLKILIKHLPFWKRSLWIR